MALILRLEKGLPLTYLELDSNFIYLSSSFIGSDITSSMTVRYANTASYITSNHVYGPHGFNSIMTSSFAITASYALNAQKYFAGPGIANIDDNYYISASVLTVNGASPINGNIATGLTATLTGPSASLVLSSSGNITSSLSDGTVWIISNDNTVPSPNGLTYIWSSGSAQWYFIPKLDQTAGDARYLQLGGGIMTGGITGSAGISLLGTASYAETASCALTASYITSSNIVGTVLSASYAETASYLPEGTYNITSSWAESASWSPSKSLQDVTTVGGTTDQNIDVQGGATVTVWSGINVGSTLNTTGVDVSNQITFLEATNSIVQAPNVTAQRTWDLPDNSGTIPLSVNGQTADSDGNIVLPTPAIGPGTQNYLAFFSGSETAISSSIAYQDGNNLIIDTTELVAISPSVDINNLYDWQGDNDLVGYTSITSFGPSIISSTTSSITLNGDITLGGAFPFPQTWTNIQLMDNNTYSWLSISPELYPNLISIVFYSQSYDSINDYYIINYSSSLVSNTFLPDTIYTAQSLTGLLIVTGSMTVTDIQPTPITVTRILVSDDNGNVYYTGSTAFGKDPFPYSGSAIITGSLIISSSNQSQLTIIGSGSTSPLFTVMNTNGEELFTVTDNLSGSLFSVGDQNGLTILDVKSDNTVLFGSYLAPALNTTVKNTIGTGTTVIYNLSTSSYDGMFIDYIIKSGSVSRVGQIMSTWNSGNTTILETSASIGTTSGFTFGTQISGSNFILSGSATSNNWTVKTIIKAI